MPAQTKGTGILVARFQTFELLPAHRQLVESVLEKHDRVIVFLGSNPAPSNYNPLDWVFRWKMLQDAFGNAIQIEDMPDLSDDRVWSQELDRRIMELRPAPEVILYGSQDNFVDRYSGRFNTVSLAGDEAETEEILPLEAVTNHRDFRLGVLYGALRRYPTVYPTVDIAVFNETWDEVLLARKANELKYRFPGGFTDPSDFNYEDAAMRELTEECGPIIVDDLTYLGSARIDDWRYRESADSIITHLYACRLEEGEPVASDDIVELRWFPVAKLNAELFVPEHRMLLEILLEFIEEEH